MNMEYRILKHKNGKFSVDIKISGVWGNIEKDTNSSIKYSYMPRTEYNTLEEARDAAYSHQERFYSEEPEVVEQFKL